MSEYLPPEASSYTRRKFERHMSVWGHLPQVTEDIKEKLVKILMRDQKEMEKFILNSKSLQ